MIKKIKNLNLRTIANSGQCFRMYEIYDNTFNVFSKDKLLRVKVLNNNTFDFDCSAKEFDYYKNYFDLKTDYTRFAKVCDNRDIFLKKCIDYSNGLRILNQDKYETTISFILSQRKTVKAIQTTIERLCALAGKKHKHGKIEYYGFPDAKSILNLSKDELLSCGMGYRTQYVIDFCKDYLLHRINLEELEKLDDETLLSRLLNIRGVGIKVASCIALFAYHRLSICPKDVWINRVLDKKYGGEIPNKYEKYAGIIQQYWFNYARLNKI